MVKTPKDELQSPVGLFYRLLKESPNRSPVPSGSNAPSPQSVSSPLHLLIPEDSKITSMVEATPKVNGVVMPHYEATDGEAIEDDVKSESDLTSLYSAPSDTDYYSLKDEAESVAELKDESESVLDTIEEDRPPTDQPFYIEVRRLRDILAEERRLRHQSTAQPRTRSSGNARRNSSIDIESEGNFDIQDPQIADIDDFGDNNEPIHASLSRSGSAPSSPHSQVLPTAVVKDEPTDSQIIPVTSPIRVKVEEGELDLSGGPTGRFVSEAEYRPVKLETDLHETKPDWRGLNLRVPEVLRRRAMNRVEIYVVPANEHTQSKTVKRKYIMKLFGGTIQECTPRISRKRGHGHYHFMYAADYLHPFCPLRPGEVGLWFSIGVPEGANLYYEDGDAGKEKLKKEKNTRGRYKNRKSHDDQGGESSEIPHHLFRGLKKGSARWLYLGEYLRERVQQLSSEEYSNIFGVKFKRAWSEAMIKGNWGRRVAIRAMYQKEHHRLPTFAEYEALCELKQPDFIDYTHGRISHEDMTVRFEEGLEIMTVYLLRPVDYLVNFQEYITAHSEDDESANPEVIKPIGLSPKSTKKGKPAKRRIIDQPSGSRKKSRFTVEDSDDDMALDNYYDMMANLGKGTKSRPRK